MLNVVTILMISGLLQSVVSLNLRNDLEALNDDAAYPSNFGLRHFKNRHGSSNNENSYERNYGGSLRHFKQRKPFLSFRDRRGDDLMSPEGDLLAVNSEEKRDESPVDANNRWMFYTNYLLNHKRSEEDDNYRQYFKNLLWNNLRTK